MNGDEETKDVQNKNENLIEPNKPQELVQTGDFDKEHSLTDIQSGMSTNWWTQAKTLVLAGWTSYVLIAIGLLGVLWLTAIAANSWVNSKAEKLTGAYKVAHKQLECKILTNPEKQNYINAQRQEIVSFANNHRDTAIEFYGYFYATFAIFSLFGLIAAIALAVITKSGIANASPHLITVFLVSMGIVILYQGFFGIFQQKTNIDNNAKLSVNYARLVNQIDTYCTTGKLNVIDPGTVFLEALPKSAPKPAPKNTATSPNANEKPDEPTTPKPETVVKVSPFYIILEPDEFINYVDWKIEQFKEFSIILDDTKIAGIDNKKLMPF
jgi:hypothetical protein